jgi:hypothetical protein
VSGKEVEIENSQGLDDIKIEGLDKQEQLLKTAEPTNNTQHQTENIRLDGNLKSDIHASKQAWSTSLQSDASNRSTKKAKVDKRFLPCSPAKGNEK